MCNWTCKKATRRRKKNTPQKVTETTRQEQTPTKVQESVTCQVCNDKIVGSYQTLNNVIHCNACATKLQEAQKNASTSENVVSERNCPECNKPVEKGVKISGKMFHSGCIVCGNCSKPLTSGEYMESIGQYHCTECIIDAELSAVNRGGIIKGEDSKF